MASSSAGCNEVERASGIVIQGIQIVIDGVDLAARISERIRRHEEVVSRYDVRLKARENRDPDEVCAGDNWKTVGDLRKERLHYVDRVTQLTLIRDHLDLDERYALTRADLKLAELIDRDFVELSPPVSCGDGLCSSTGE